MEIGILKWHNTDKHGMEEKKGMIEPFGSAGSWWGFVSTWSFVPETNNRKNHCQKETKLKNKSSKQIAENIQHFSKRKSKKKI